MLPYRTQPAAVARDAVALGDSSVTCSRSCGVSSERATVHSPQGAGASGVPKAEYAAGARSALGRRERPVLQVLQAGQDEIGAGAGAVAVSITREELSQSFLIGQVRGILAAGSE